MGPMLEFSDEIERHALFGLWKKQKQVLIDSEIPEAMGISEQEFSDYLDLSARGAIEGGMGHRPPLIPFLIVIGERAVSIMRQFKLLKVNSFHNSIRLRVDSIKERRDDLRFSNLIYLIFGVDDGSSTVNVAPKDCRKRFAESKRWGLSVVEGLALLRLRPELVHHHGIDLVESSYEALEVASIWGNAAEEKLVLGARRIDDKKADYGSPSSVITRPPTGGTRDRLPGMVG